MGYLKHISAVKSALCSTKLEQNGLIFFLATKANHVRDLFVVLGHFLNRVMAAKQTRLAPVVQKLDGAIHRINSYQVDK